MSSAEFFLDKSENNDNKRREYEELLIRRDQLFKDRGSYLTEYTQEFGDMLTANFEIKVECIKTKKAISYCRRRINRGLAIDLSRMQEEVEGEMTLYYIQLKEMIEDKERAKKAGTVSGYRLDFAKRIYRRLTKLLHPDINKKTEENEKLMELWTRIVTAYQRSDVNELNDLEALVHRVMEDIGDESFEFEPEDIEARIERVEDQINDILTTEPYIYRELLEDEEKKQAYREQLQAEHDDYEEYLENLKKSLDEMLRDGGARMVWKMN
ncbi:MAG: hypothetical protein K5987_07055 [Lachnospiraceae bacterium]|nr:hypothetical protein [Lachnospiraceae bacterium]